LVVEIVVHAVVFAAGIWLALRVLLSAIRAFILPRGSRDPIVGFVFRELRRVFNRIAPKKRPYRERDRIFSYYAPVALAVLAVTWLILVMLGFTAIFWGLGGYTVGEAFRLSGSSLLTLGSSIPTTGIDAIFTFIEAITGLGLAALLVGYLPTMYAAYARREVEVGLLEVWADRPASAATMLTRYQQLRHLDGLADEWRRWELLFAEVVQSHTTLSAIAFYRSAQPEQSWIVAAGAVLDATALSRSLLDIPASWQADLTFRAGTFSLRRIADFFGIKYNLTPSPDDVTSVTREKFDSVAAELAAAGLPLRVDRDAAYRDFNGARAAYDRPLLALSRLVLAPEALWNTWPDRDEFGRFGPTPGDAG